MTTQQHQSAATYWTIRSRVEMSTVELKQYMEEFITTNSVCALAKGADDYMLRSDFKKREYDSRQIIEFY